MRKKAALFIVAPLVVGIGSSASAAPAEPAQNANERACFGQAVASWEGEVARNYGEAVKKDAQNRDRPGLEWPNVRANYAGTNRSIACDES